MKKDEEIRNDELKFAMITFKLQDDEETEEIFIEELKKAYFLIPALKSDQKDELTIMLLTNQDGENYFQVYTDIDEYGKWINAEDSQSFVLDFNEFANIVIASDDDVKGLVINPFSQNVVLDKDCVKKIFRSDKIWIDEVSKCPSKIVNSIKKVLVKCDAIKRAYLMNMTKNNIAGYLLIIDSKRARNEKLFKRIGSDIVNEIDRINIDIVSANDDEVRDLIKDKKPFYIGK